MKKIFITVFFVFACSLTCFSETINYGYNAHGDYVPKSYGSQRIEYGYNAHGDYVPKSVGGQRIEYGYNAHGQYVPKSVGR